MPTPVSDEAFARVALQMGAATVEQIEAARKLQNDKAQQGAQLSLGEALVQQGVLTPVLKGNIERRASAPAPAQGPRQLGNYKLQKKLGEGGMGTVYLAEDTMLARQVAIKILSERFSAQPEFLSRFKREAISTGKLNHPNVVGAYAVGDEAGNHYYVMEYCTGEPLDKVLRHATVFNEELALDVVAQVCRGLHYAHQHGVIHRDIKPGNIFLTSDGTAKILDLGLSKNLAAADSSFQTVSGTALGTPHYISPEQAKGEKDVDGRTDIYSLGATLYHLVTGRTPFEGSSPAAVMMKHLSEQLPDPRDLNPDLSEGVVHIIAKAMAKDREGRYASCAEMLSDLELVQKGEAPGGAALDALHSSVAMRAPVRQARAAGAGAAPRRTPGTGAAGVRRTGERTPVAEEARRPTGRGREEIPAAPGSYNRTYFIIGGAVAGVLLLLGLILAFSGDGKPTTTAKGRPEQGKQTPSTSTQPATPEQPAKVVPAAQPEAVKGVTDAWIKSVQALPAEQQVEEVVKKLKELNPGYDGQPTYKAENGQVTELSFTTERVADITPVRALPALRKLTCTGVLDPVTTNPKGERGKLSDLTPLKGSRLSELNCTYSQITDLTPLAGVPLTRLDCSRNPQITDLTPLKGMPLTALLLMDAKVSDLSPLRGMKLTYLNIAYSTAGDLSPLEGMPLTDLRCQRSRVRDLTPLRGMPLAKLHIGGLPVSDLTPLKGAPLSELLMDGVPVSDLSPLKDAPLKRIGGDFVRERDAAILRSIKTLATINDLPAAEFWARYGATGQASVGAPRPGGVPADAMEFRGHWYKVVREKATRQQAQEKCAALGGHLATLTSLDENEFVRELARKANEPVWIGLYLEGGQWKWVTGEKLEFQGWGAGEPAGAGKEDGVDLWGTKDWKWCDFGGQNKVGFACEWEPAAGGGKVLVSEDFEKLDLNKLPAGWKTSGLPNSLVTIVEQPNRGKVLRTSRKAGDPLDAILQVVLDPGMVNGHTIRASVMACCPAGYTPISQPAGPWWKPRLHLKLDGRIGYDSFLAEDERGWRQLLLSRQIPDGTTSVLVEIGLPRVNGEAFFDDLVVELDPDPKSAPPKPAAGGGKVLVSESFETLDLDKLPAGWSIAGPARRLLTIVEQPGHGKVLRAIRKGNDPDATIIVELDAAKVRGHKLSANAMVFCPAGYSPDPAAGWAGPRIGLKVSGKLDWANRADPARLDWHRHGTAPCPIPNDAERVTLFFGVQGVAAEAFFDDLVVELDPDPRSDAAAMDAPALWKDAVSLLALFDANQDCVRTNWKMENGLLVGPKAAPAIVQFPYKPPAEYDYRVVFTTKVEGDGYVNHSYLFPAAGRSLKWCLRADMASFNRGPKQSLEKMDWEKQHVSLVQVRAGSVKGWLDGKLLAEWTGDFSVGTVHELRDDALAGLADHLSATTYHRVEIVEISGKGTFTRPDDPAAKEAKKKQDEVWAKREKTGATQPDADARK